MVKVEDLVDNMNRRQGQVCRPSTFTMDDLPTIGALETAIRKAKYNKAPGLDGLPGELLKGDPATAALNLMPLVMKMTLRRRRAYIMERRKALHALQGKGRT